MNLTFKVRGILIVILFLVSVLGCADDKPKSPPPPSEKATEFRDVDIQEIAQGGYVLFFRHATRDAEPQDIDFGALDRAGTCIVGSELNAQGRAESIKLGELFRNRGVVVNRVITSPSCRTRQMGTLAFGSEGDVQLAAGRPAMWTAEELSIMLDQQRGYLSLEPMAGRINVILSHCCLNASVFKVDYNLLQGDAGVFKPSGNDFEFVGLFRKAVWMNLPL